MAGDGWGGRPEDEDTSVGGLSRMSLVGCAVRTVPIANALASRACLSAPAGLGHTPRPPQVHRPLTLSKTISESLVKTPASDCSMSGVPLQPLLPREYLRGKHGIRLGSSTHLLRPYHQNKASEPQFRIAGYSTPAEDERAEPVGPASILILQMRELRQRGLK